MNTGILLPIKKYRQIKALYKKYPKMSARKIAEIIKVHHSTVLKINKGIINDETYKEQKEQKENIKFKKEINKDFKENTGVITVKSLNIETVKEALKYAEVDTNIWEVEHHVINSWEVTIGGHHTGTKKCETYTNFQVKIWLKKKEPKILAYEKLLEKIENHSPIVKSINYKQNKKQEFQRQLEISLMDIHLGLRCYKESGADLDWSPEIAKEITEEILSDLLILCDQYKPFEKIIFPFGHDFLHIDNVYATTTRGTPQPGSEPWGVNLIHSEILALTIIETLKQIAPVKIIVIPGNHARHSEIGLGRFLSAYYRNDKNVEVDATIQPYKFHNYGVNLIGFEHGHSIKQQVRLAALMANECRLNGWKEARYCEFHCGDQHRKGSGRPMMFEEQGVSVEFLPSLVVPNEWHKIHSYNWQKRAGMAFIWDKTAGPIARLQVNLDNYTGKVMK